MVASIKFLKSNPGYGLNLEAEQELSERRMELVRNAHMRAEHQAPELCGA